MAEYIEKGVAKHAVDLAIQLNETEYDMVCNAIDREPSADVAPVRHGNWKYYKKQGIAVCTECSFERKLDDNFGRAVSCPNCGAKMV